jgi:hypothetical protein
VILSKTTAESYLIAAWGTTTLTCRVKLSGKGEEHDPMHIKRHTGHLTIRLRKGVDSVTNHSTRTCGQIATVTRKFIDTREDISELAIGLSSVINRH